MNVKIKIIQHPSEKLISQLLKLFYQEWNEDISRWLDDLHFYLIEKNWELMYIESGNHLIGTAIYKHLPRTNSVAVAYLIVHKNFRGRGLGSLLMSEIEKVAQDIGASCVFFDSSEPLGKSKENFFINKLGYLIVKLPLLLPDEPPATYLFIKFLQPAQQQDNRYLKDLLMEYIFGSYSKKELEACKKIFRMTLSVIGSLNSVCLTKEPFLKKYIGTEYTKKPCREFSEEKLREFVSDVLEEITSQPCGTE